MKICQPCGMSGFHKLPKTRFSPLDLTSWMVGCRAGRQNWLQGQLAELPCNLPEQLQALMLTGAAADGQEHGSVTRRAMLKLLPSATVRMVPTLELRHATSCGLSMFGCRTQLWRCAAQLCRIYNRA